MRWVAKKLLVLTHIPWINDNESHVSNNQNVHITIPFLEQVKMSSDVFYVKFPQKKILFID